MVARGKIEIEPAAKFYDIGIYRSAAAPVRRRRENWICRVFFKIDSVARGGMANSISLIIAVCLIEHMYNAVENYRAGCADAVFFAAAAYRKSANWRPVFEVVGS